jgi:hypothetical protein
VCVPLCANSLNPPPATPARPRPRRHQNNPPSPTLNHRGRQQLVAKRSRIRRGLSRDDDAVQGALAHGAQQRRRTVAVQVAVAKAKA